MHTRMYRPLGVLISAGLFVLLSACGADETTESSSESQHNDADVMFATDMIPHHAQAIEMAEMAISQAQSQQVVDLAVQIEAAQDPEIATMSGWLESWGEPVAEADMGSMGDMPGMMSTQDMQGLMDTSGAEFDRMWLAMMIEHHEGAVEMARSELADGESVEAKGLAQEIIDGQEAEIVTMKKLLANGGR